MLTDLCAKREVQYAQRENDLKREREDLIRRGFDAQNQLNTNQNEYKKKLEAMTKIYKKAIDVRQELYSDRSGMAGFNRILLAEKCRWEGRDQSWEYVSILPQNYENNYLQAEKYSVQH